METRYIHPNAVLDIADQSYFADVEVELVNCRVEQIMRSSRTGHKIRLFPYEGCSLSLTFSDEKSLMAFELSFDGPVTIAPPTAFEPQNHAPLSPEAAGVIRSHIAELQAEARRDKINTTEEELSAHLGRHEGD